MGCKHYRRQDSDGDGIPDVVEERFGTDPTRADTDRDRIPDGKDRIPRAAPVKSPKDRNALLDMIIMRKRTREEQMSLAEKSFTEVIEAEKKKRGL